MKDKFANERMDRFQHLVLGALWIIILFLAKKDIAASDNVCNLVGEFRRFGDDYGTPGEEAKQYRRDRTYRHIY